MASVVLFFSSNTNFQNAIKIMINTNELRIGNYVKSAKYMSKKRCLTKVKTLKHAWKDSGYKLVLNKECVATCEEFGSDLEKEVMPIKLNKKWFLKAGYKKKNGYGYIHSKILGNIFESQCGHFYVFQYYDIRIELRYVHQLQNLYFALCGEELVFSTEP